MNVDEVIATEYTFERAVGCAGHGIDHRMIRRYGYTFRYDTVKAPDHQPDHLISKY